METLDLLQDFVKRRVGELETPLSPEMKLEDIGLDSLMLLDLMFDLEDQYKVTMPDDLPRPETVGDLIAVFEQLKSSANA